MSKQSIINVKAERDRRASLGLCVHCAKPSLPDKFGKVWRGCDACRRGYAQEARVMKNILYPEAPPVLFTAKDWKPTELAEKILADKTMSERFKKRGLDVER